MFEPDRLKTICSLSLAALLLAACNVRLAGNDGEMVVEGFVRSTDGTPVSATLTAADVTVAADGGFYLLHLPAPNGRVPVAASATGFAPTVNVVEQRAGVFHYHSDVVLQPLQKLLPGADGGSFSVASGNAAIFVSFAGNVAPFGGHVEVVSFSPELTPGAGETSEGDDQRLQSLGAAYVRVVDASDHEASFGGPVTFTVVDRPAITGAGPQHTYGINDDSIWVPAVNMDSAAAFTATTSGFWQAARAVKTACVKGTVVAPNRACSGERVQASASGVVSVDTTNGSGAFCVEGPQGSTTATLQVGITSKVVTFPAHAGNCSNAGDCSAVGELTVTDEDCPFSCLKTQTDDPAGCRDGGR